MFFETKSKNQTKKLAKLLCQTILKEKIQRLPADRENNKALVIALSGDLGAGKTTFVQGLMNGAGIKKKITSPTFVLMKKFQIPKAKFQINSKFQNLKFKNIYHIDCYRIKKTEELFNLGLKEILKNPQNIVLIEWPEIIKRYLSKDVIRIEFEHGKKENERQLVIK